MEEACLLYVKGEGAGKGWPKAFGSGSNTVSGVCAGRSRTSLVKVAVPTVPPQDTALLALTSSALVIIVLVLLALSIIYCKRFWKSQCQRGESVHAAFLCSPFAVYTCFWPLCCWVEHCPENWKSNIPLFIENRWLILLFTSAGLLLLFCTCTKTQRILPPP